MTTKTIIGHLTLLVMLGTAAMPLFGQSGQGGIRGTVTDSTGAVVPEADIRGTNVATGVTSSTVTSTGGVYNIPITRAGIYRIEASKAGFKKEIQDNVLVGLEQTVGVNFRLEVGAVVQTVEVKGAASTLNTETAEVTTSIPPEPVQNLPISASGGRSPLSILAYAPGTNGSTSRGLNGGQAGGAEIEMDGLTTTVSPFENGGNQFTMAPEAVQEASTSAGLAESDSVYNSQGIFRVTTRGGTNQLHGNAYEFNVNTAYNARGELAKDTGITKQNEFGYSIGGPVYIPKVYDGRDRTFFFWNMNWFRSVPAPTNALTSLPPLAFREGNFSALLPQVQIYDPATTRPDGKGGFIRDPFPGNIIPLNRESKVSANVFGPSVTSPSWIPLPQFPGYFNNETQTGGAHNVYFTTALRIDHRFSDSHSFSAIMTRRVPTSDSFGPYPGITGGESITVIAETNSRFLYDVIITPRLSNHLAVGINMQHQSTVTVGQEHNPSWSSILGLTNITTGNDGASFPRVTMSPYDLAPQNGGHGNQFPQNVITMRDTAALVKGKQTLKFGGDYSKYYEDSVNLSSNGQYIFSANETDLPTKGGATTGYPMASMFLGLADSASRRYNETKVHQRDSFFGIFGQDDIKLRPNFTLNLGTRWDFYKPVWDSQNDYGMMDPSVPNPGCGGCPGALVFAGYGPGRVGSKYLPGFNSINHRNFSPRIGLAWAFKNKTVVRAAYSLTHIPPPGALTDNVRTNDQGWSASPSFFSENSGLTPAFDWDNGFPAFLTPPDLIPNFANGGATQLWHDATTSPYLQQWTLNIQRQFGSTWKLQVAYVGTKGNHLTSAAFNLNQTPSSYLYLGNKLNLSIYDPAVVALGFKPPYIGFTGSLAQALRPFPQYTFVGTADVANGNVDSVAIGDSIYHSGQVQLDKQYSNGLYLLTSFVWDKLLTNADAAVGGSNSSAPYGRDYYNRKLDYGLSPGDVDWSAVTAFTYEFPIGPGKHFVNVKGPIGKIVGGWQLNGVLTYRAAVPIRETTNDSLPIFTFLQIPNVVPGVNQRAHGCGGFQWAGPNKDLYLNPAAFSQPAPYTIGDGPSVLNVRGCPTRSENLGLMKTTKITERISFQFRAEFFNVFNRHTIGAPAANLSNLTAFGTVSSIGGNRSGQLAGKIVF